MTKADRVLSTPPLNSSSIQSTNPPPEARAESVDSFSCQPAIGQPESGNLTSESGKPVKGLSRRHMLAGLAILPTSAVGIPITAAAAAASIPVASTSIANADAKINAPLMRAEEMVKALREGYCSEDFELDERAAELMLSYLRSRDMWADDLHLSNEELDEDTEKFYRNVADFADRYNQSLDWLVRGDPSVMICSRAAQSQEAAKAVDPIFSVIEACHQADAERLAVAGDIPDEIGQRWSDAEKAVMRTRPTTPSGLAALTTWARQKADWLRANHSCLMEEDFFALTAQRSTMPHAA